MTSKRSKATSEESDQIKSCALEFADLISSMEDRYELNLVGNALALVIATICSDQPEPRQAIEQFIHALVHFSDEEDMETDNMH